MNCWRAFRHGLFSWLRNLFSPRPTERKPSSRPATCLYCGATIQSAAIRQCPKCGRNWDGSAVETSAPEVEAPESNSSGASAETPVTPWPEPQPVTKTEESRPAPPPRPSVKPAAQPPAERAPLTRDQFDSSEFVPTQTTQLDENSQSIAPLEALLQQSPVGFTLPAEHQAGTQRIESELVERGMVTRERLAEIRELDRQAGEARAKLREQITTVRAEDEAARAEQKQQKQAKSAERKRRRREEIARRRTEDIVFLGRGVSHGLADRQSNASQLAERGLPVLATPAAVAAALGISIPRLRWLAFHNVCATRMHYVMFEVARRSGGKRQLAAPHRALARCQKWIEQEILNKLPVHNAAQGFVRGRSILTNARPHVGQELIVNLDLQDFFPTITFPRVAGLLRSLGYSPAAATVLALLTTECPRTAAEFAGRKYFVALGERSLPQGACTSPAISNLIAYTLDCRLAGLAQSGGWTYTRYADDLTFSISAEVAARRQTSARKLISGVQAIVQSEGFRLNERKSRVLRPSSRQLVTGVVVNEQTSPPRELLRRLRAILHRAKHEGLAVQNRQNHPNFRDWLEGQIAFVQMLKPAAGKKLREQLQTLSGETS